MMEASILDLRYRMRDVLDALERRETVLIRHRGKIKGKIVPHGSPPPGRSAAEHPFFGMLKDDARAIQDVMSGLRKPRYPGDAV